MDILLLDLVNGQKLLPTRNLKRVRVYSTRMTILSLLSAIDTWWLTYHTSCSRHTACYQMQTIYTVLPWVTLDLMSSAMLQWSRLFVFAIFALRRYLMFIFHYNWCLEWEHCSRAIKTKIVNNRCYVTFLTNFHSKGILVGPGVIVFNTHPTT